MQSDVEPSDVYVLTGAIIDSVRYGVIVSVKKENFELPLTFSLYQNYPNPFNPATTIRYTLSVDSYAVLNVYNVLGQEVISLVQDEQKAGWHETTFEASNLANGIYLYRLQVGKFAETKKMILIK